MEPAKRKMPICENLDNLRFIPMPSYAFALTFAAYDSRTIEGYEGPCECPEEVSLTSLTDKPK
jgi:hypothetical protein